MRESFARTVKANLPCQLRVELEKILKFDVIIKYCEFLNEAGVVFPTEGLLQYEKAYRAWIADPHTPNKFISQFELCASFVQGGRCLAGEECGAIHADLKKSLTRDKLLLAALHQFCQQSMGEPTLSSPVELLPDQDTALPLSSGGRPFWPGGREGPVGTPPPA